VARLDGQIQTSLAIREVAALFQQAMRVNFIDELLGRGTKFSKPPTDEAFGDLDDDPPSFSVMATLGGQRAEVQVSAVVLFAWDRGDHRDLLINEGRALLSMGIKSKWKVQRYVAKLQELDPTLKVVGL
jgi:hypothetical protein